MKTVARPTIPILRTLSSLLSNPSNLLFSHHFSFSSSSSPSPSPSSPPLLPPPPPSSYQKAQEEEPLLTQVNLLIPRLCQSSTNLPHAIRLLDASFLLFSSSNSRTNLPSISIPVLIHRLTDEPDLTQPMSLLTRLHRNARAHPHLLSVARMLASSYFKKRRPKEALKILNWMSRANSFCVFDEPTYAVFLTGFCRNGWSFEALRVMRRMLAEGMVPGENLRKWVFRSLLSEARVREALELDAALGCLGCDRGGDGLRAASALTDRMLAEWKE